MPRYTIDMSRKFNRVLSGMACDQGSHRADIIRKAVASYAYLKREERAGNMVVIRDDTRIRKHVFLP